MNSSNSFRLVAEAVRAVRLYRNWPEIISNHFRTGRKTTVLVLRNGVKYAIHPDSSDMGLVREIYEENVYRVGRGDIAGGDVVIDIGAHIGVFSVFAATRAEDVTVYSFEPDPDNFRLLLKNIELNHLEGRVHPFNLAVSDTNRPRKLVRSAESLSAHSFFVNKFPEAEIRDAVEVKCTTLSEILEKNAIERCALLKLDCEGEEFNILQNAPDGVMARITKIVGEYHDGLTRYNHQDLGNFLASKNFEVQIRESQAFPNFRVGFLCASRLRDNQPAD